MSASMSANMRPSHCPALERLAAHDRAGSPRDLDGAIGGAVFVDEDHRIGSTRRKSATTLAMATSSLRRGP